MIDLKFGKYGIKTADRMNIVLYELVENKKVDSPNYGETREKVLGYYGELEHALNAYVKVAAADENTSLTSVYAVTTWLQLIKEQIRTECAKLRERPATEGKQGEWKNNKNDYPECTICGYMPMYDHSIDDIYYSSYCPNCGAKMTPTEE